MRIREYTKNDLPFMTALWGDAFGDAEVLVRRFYELLPEMGTAFVAECTGFPSAWQTCFAPSCAGSAAAMSTPWR